jgi:CRISPR-associated protein Cst2
MATLASLAIAARATLNLHSLNNEGGEGNQIQTRMCDVVDADGKLHSVNAVSGDMMRHIVAEHLLRVALDRDLPLSEGARRLDANRINADSAMMADIKELGSDPDALNYLLEHCAITDIMGTLITQGNRALPRKSVLEFGWVIGVPDKVRSDSYFHVKYSADRGVVQRAQDRSDAEDAGSNRGQAIFYRPASSGVYAVVCHLELARIGYNDLTQRYAIDEAGRLVRAQALLDATLYSFLELNGAMRAAQLPHLTALQGVISTSSGVVPAPLISPLAGGADDADAYRVQVENIGLVLDGQNGSEVKVQRFETLAEFASQLRRTSDNLRLASLITSAA